MSNAKLTFTTRVEEMKAGLESALPASVTALPMDAQLVPLTKVAHSFQQYLDADHQVELAKAALQQALAARNALVPTTHRLLQAVTVLVKQLFGTDATALAKFGVTLKPRKVVSAAQKAASVAKGQLTRKQNRAATPARAQPRVVVYGADGQPIGDTQANAPTVPAIPPVSGSGTK